jgi:hypothetical protein
VNSSEKLYHIIQICHIESTFFKKKRICTFCSKCSAGRAFFVYNLSSRKTPAISFVNTPVTATALTREGDEEGGGEGGACIRKEKEKGRGEGAARGREGRGCQEEPYILGGAPQLCFIPYPFT